MVQFPRNSKLLHLGYKIKDVTSHEVDGGNNDDDAMPYSVGQDYLCDLLLWITVVTADLSTSIIDNVSSIL